MQTQTQTPDNVLDRVRKLLRLAQHAGSEAEAALASTRAAELMARHEIDAATISLESSDTRAAEPIDRAHRVTATKKKVGWHMRLAGGAAALYGCRAYWWGGAVQLFGRQSAVQAAGYTAQYLIREVERLVDAEHPSQSHTRADRNAWRYGCAERIGERLREQAAARRPRAEPEAQASEPEAQASEPEPAAAPSPLALAVVERDREEVAQEYASYSRDWGSGASIGNSYYGSGGYGAGRAAGNRASIGGGGRGLPSGRKVLK